MDLMDGERPAARIACTTQALPGIPRDLVLRIVPVLGPGERDLSRRGEAGQLIDVPAGLVPVDASAEPDHRAHAEVAAQVILDVLAREPRIAVRIEEALLRRQARSLSVHMNGTALEHERGAVAIVTLDLEHFLRDFLVPVPGKVQAP